MEIPFHKPYITEEEIAEVLDSLKSGWITMGTIGPKTVRFEEVEEYRAERIIRAWYFFGSEGQMKLNVIYYKI